ncbi:MAG: histidine phosphatase family protein [Bacilli bacterium]
MVTIYLVRHGETDWNRKLLCQGRIDNLLNNNGKEGAKELGQNILNSNIKIDYILSSPLKRAQETAKIIQQEINNKEQIKIDLNFLEREFGELEGTDVVPLRKLVITPEVNKVKGYEKDNEVGERMLKGLLELEKQYQNSTILIVSHSHAIKCLLQTINKNIYSLQTKLPNMNMSKLHIENGKITVDKLSVFETKTIDPT